MLRLATLFLVLTTSVAPRTGLSQTLDRAAYLDRARQLLREFAVKQKSQVHRPLPMSKEIMLKDS